MPSRAEFLDIHIGDKTMKKMITIVRVISLCAVTLFLTACSSYNTHSSDEAMQESKYQEGYLATEEATIETTIPIIAQAEDVDNSLSEKEYWSCVDEEILGIFKNNDLYVIRVDTGAPYEKTFDYEPLVFSRKSFYFVKVLRCNAFSTYLTYFLIVRSG